MMVTAQQQKAIDDGRAVEITVGGTPCVVMRREIYSRLERLLSMDEFNPGEGMKAMNELMAEDDANDTLLESYQRFGNPS